VLWLKQNGINPTTRNQVLRMALETLVDGIADVRPELKVASVEDAYGFLEEAGLLPGVGGRARSQLAKALNIERLNRVAPKSLDTRDLKTKNKQASYADEAEEAAKLMAERRIKEAKQSEAFKSMKVVKPETPS
jgi:hypothetical protein